MPSPLTFPLGLDAEGNPLICDLAEAPHMLVAGMTGSGKSTMINSMLVSILMRQTPDDVGLVLIDPKMVEFSPYEGVQHLMMPVVKDSMLAAETLDWLVQEMEDRYVFCEHHGVRNLEELNAKLPVGERFPSIICVVDELADLMMVARQSVEASVIRLAQKARAIGIHLVLATQSPRVGVVTGMIKSNMPSRIAFTTAQMVDSRVIMDRGGAENLLNNGDGLYLAGDAGVPTRFQGAYVSIEDVEAVCDHWRSQGPVQYPTEEVAA